MPSVLSRRAVFLQRGALFYRIENEELIANSNEDFTFQPVPQGDKPVNTNKVIACFQKSLVTFLTLMLMFVGYSAASGQQEKEKEMTEMLVRISEVEVVSEYLNEYKAILKEEAEASVSLEPGVIAIFPMYQKGNPTQVRILEIYATREAYELHLKTPHFQKYKTTTLKMVKSLKLVDMEAMDAETMTQIFKKMKKM
jgi:quinol monooxygenase YgiN